MSIVGPEDARSPVGRLLGDGLAGSCWRAVEQAETPDVEVRVYVRSFAEATVGLNLILTMLLHRKLIVAGKSVDKDKAMQLAHELDAVVAIELVNGSVVVFKKQEQPEANK